MVTMGHYAHQRCLITGASSGLGAAMALALAAQGASLVLTGRDRERLEKVAQQCRSAGAAEVTADICDFADNVVSGRFVAEKITGPNKPIDLLFHCAAINMVGNIADLPLDQVRNCLSVNFTTAVMLVQAVLPLMQRAGKGHIVFVSSGTAFFGVPGEGIYSASKAALERLGETLLQEVGSAGLAVTIVSPGPMETPALRSPVRYGGAELIGRPATAADPRDIAARILRRLPAKPRQLTLSLRPLAVRILACFAPGLLIRLLARPEKRG